jgi:Cu/Ag efflux protein CusF
MIATIGLIGLLWLDGAPAQGVNAQRILDGSEPITLTATIEKIDAATRTVTMKSTKGQTVEIAVPDDMQGFETMKVGDIVTATYYEAIAVQIRRPGDPAPPADPMVTTQRRERTPGSERRRQQTVTVTVQSIDTAAGSVTVKGGPRDRVLTVIAADPKQLKTLKTGDLIDVTYYESLLVQVKKGK